jgi:hypothetical protein
MNGESFRSDFYDQYQLTAFDPKRSFKSRTLEVSGSINREAIDLYA